VSSDECPSLSGGVPSDPPTRVGEERGPRGCVIGFTSDARGRGVCSHPGTGRFVEVAQLLALPLREGGSVVVDVDEAGRGAVTRGGGRSKLVTEAGETFEDALDRVLPAFRSLIAKLRAAAEDPDEVRIDFGLSLNAEVGALIARTAGEANFTVSVTWSRDRGEA
jgi:hypothetical protein